MERSRTDIGNLRIETFTIRAHSGYVGVSSVLRAPAAGGDAVVIERCSDGPVPSEQRAHEGAYRKAHAAALRLIAREFFC